MKQDIHIETIQEVLADNFAIFSLRGRRNKLEGSWVATPSIKWRSVTTCLHVYALTHYSESIVTLDHMR
jgi:hypothetical protein